MGTGKIIKERLEEKGITVADLSRKTGIPASSLYAIISRDSEKVKFATLLKISEVIDCSPLELITENNLSAVDDLKKHYNIPDPTPEEMRVDALENAFYNLNEFGQKVAIERVEELTEIPKYQKED